MKTALDVALTYLSRRSLACNELEQRLVQKGFAIEEVTQTLERLTEWGYLNDHEYARSFIRTKQGNYSKKRIGLELKRKGIEEELIQETLEETYLPIQERELCSRQAQRILTEESRRWESTYQYKKSYAKIPREAFIKQKVGQKLLLKGFSLELIHQVIEEIMGRD
jgi:regulatory protein